MNLHLFLRALAARDILEIARTFEYHRYHANVHDTARGVCDWCAGHVDWLWAVTIHVWEREGYPRFEVPGGLLSRLPYS